MAAPWVVECGKLPQHGNTGMSASRNRTLTCTPTELAELSAGIVNLESDAELSEIDGQLIAGDFLEVAKHLPGRFVDLLILDPPYNLTKNFNGNHFRRLRREGYATWFEGIITLLEPMLKPDATVYVCADWRTSTIVFPVLEKRFTVQNRITWEREKGRGARRNWKNNTEDIWFCTKSDEYYFDVESVKLKRRVLAPYRENGQPRDWKEESGGNYRLTYPSNIWSDITVPFWSMPENTQHPTQKPEKLFAKLILSSSRENDFVLDPFVGSGTSAVVAEKLGRRWCGIDISLEYLCWARKRLRTAREDSTIQGYENGVFWERNSRAAQTRNARRVKQEEVSNSGQGTLFG